MIDVSTHISGTQGGLPVHGGFSTTEAVENQQAAGLAKKGGAKEAPDGLGVFGKLLAGLLKKGAGVPAGGAEALAGAASGAEAAGRDKFAFADKPAQAGAKARNPTAPHRNEAARKQGGELAPDKKAEKPEKKRGGDVLARFEQRALAVPESAAGRGKANAGFAGGDLAKSVVDKAGLDRLLGEKTGEAAEDGAGSDKTGRLSGKKPEPAGRAAETHAAVRYAADAVNKQEQAARSRDNAAFGRAAGRTASGSRASAEDAKKPRRKERIIVEDLRTPRGPDPAAFTTETFVEKGASGKELVVELRAMDGKTFSGGAGLETPDSYGREGTRNFESILANQLQGELSSDIVRQAAFVLRDGGEGTIRLALKPETLGKVKIHLEMAENKISGHIVVESEEALRAFEREIHTLEQAFRDSGFNEASLDTALDSGDGGNNRNNEAETAPFYSGRAASTYEAGSGFAGMEAGSYSGNGFFAVNVLI